MMPCYSHPARNLGNQALVIVELAIALAPRVELVNVGYRSRWSDAVGANQSNKAVELSQFAHLLRPLGHQKHQISMEAYDGRDP